MERYLAAFECVCEKNGEKHQLMCLPLRLENGELALVVNAIGSRLAPELMHYDAAADQYGFTSTGIPGIFLDAAGAINSAVREQLLIQTRTGQVSGD